MKTLQDWVGHLIKQAREECGLTQQYVADEINMDIRTLRSIEEGKTDPDFLTLEKLIRFLHISPKIMFYAEQNESGLQMDKVYRQLLHFTPEQISMIYESSLHVRSWYQEHDVEYREFLEKHSLC